MLSGETHRLQVSYSGSSTCYMLYRNQCRWFTKGRGNFTNTMTKCLLFWKSLYGDIKYSNYCCSWFWIHNIDRRCFILSPVGTGGADRNQTTKQCRKQFAGKLCSLCSANVCMARDHSNWVRSFSFIWVKWPFDKILLGFSATEHLRGNSWRGLRVYTGLETNLEWGHCLQLCAIHL